MTLLLTRCSLLILVGFIFSGCLHTPPAGAERGIVSVGNDRMWEDSELFPNAGILTGVAIDTHVILTAAHTFLYEPELDHPIRINGELVSYEIIADGWEGMRDQIEYKSKQVPSNEFIQRDFLLLRTTQSFESNLDLVPLSFDRIAEVRDATLVTRRQDTGAVEMLPLLSLTITTDKTIGFTTLKKNARFDPEDYFLSGSPLIGKYQDGTLVLLGLANSRGEIQIRYDRKRWAHKQDQMLFTPASTIPFSLLDD